MKRPHLLRVEQGPEAFAPLLAAVRASSLRAGWLELAEVEPLPPHLVAASELGVMRAVAVGERGSVAIKPRTGAPVLEDLLREHFLGCRLVLVKAPSARVEAPVLSAAGEGRWRLEVPGGATEEVATEALVARLGKPRPWG